jgi:hypothetical protein
MDVRLSLEAMKTCSYCGHDCSDDAVSCSSCGTQFPEPLSATPGSPFRRPPRPGAASIVLRDFLQEVPAQQALATLQAAHIEAYIATDDCGGVLPPLNAGSPFRLIVSDVHRDAAEQVLADMERKASPIVRQPARMDPTKPVDSSAASASPSTFRSLGVAALGMAAGVLLVLGYQRAQETFSGTDRRDFNHDGRTDAWDTYVKGQFSKMAADNNGDERPDVWYYYDDGKTTRWEEDLNFDGQFDLWGVYDARGVPNQSTVDLDFDGKPDVTHFYQFGLLKESHYIVPVLSGSGLVWKKNLYTNGLLREELLDRDRDGKFDEKLFFDLYGVEVKKEKLN